MHGDGYYANLEKMRLRNAKYVDKFGGPTIGELANLEPVTNLSDSVGKQIKAGMIQAVCKMASKVISQIRRDENFGNN